MGPEANIELIRTLERRIKKGKGDIIKLKRERNSLLNVSTRVPPEILGYVFAWIVAREQDDTLFSTAHFARLEDGLYDFLLVCHHWFEVASSTPEVWTFWGRTLEDWRNRCHRVGGAPVDLVLNGFAKSSMPFDSFLRDALNDRASQDGIRQIHMVGNNPSPIGTIISSLTPNDKSPQQKRIESINLQTDTIPEELSYFFTHSRLPNLRCLHIGGRIRALLPPHPTEQQVRVSFWDELALLQTTRLVTLSLYIEQAPTFITASQLTPILVSNPNLRELHLMHSALPDDTDWPSTQVSLRRLKTIVLGGEFDRVFSLLNRLEFPVVLDRVVLQITDFTTEDILQSLGPYLRDRFQRDTRFQDRLTAIISHPRFSDGFGDNMRGRIDLTSPPSGTSPSARFSMSLISTPPPSLVGIFAFIPHEHVTTLEIEDFADIPESLLVMMRNIETLRILNTELSDGFLVPDPAGPYANAKLLPSLRSLDLKDVTVNGSNWEPLIAYLVHQTYNGQAISLKMSSSSYLFPQVMEEIRSLVETFDYIR